MELHDLKFNLLAGDMVIFDRSGKNSNLDIFDYVHSQLLCKTQTFFLVFLTLKYKFEDNINPLMIYTPLSFYSV